MSATIGLACFAGIILVALALALWIDHRAQRRADADARLRALEREARKHASSPEVPVAPFRTRLPPTPRDPPRPNPLVEEALAKTRRRATSGELPVARGEVTTPTGHAAAPGPKRGGA